MPRKYTRERVLDTLRPGAIVGGSPESSAADPSPGLSRSTFDAPVNLGLATALGRSASTPMAVIVATWDPPSESTSQINTYTVQWSTAAGFTASTTTSQDTPYDSITIDSLKTGTTYYVRVACWQRAIQGDWSDVASITTVADTAAPDPPTLPSASFDVGGSLNVAWTPPAVASSPNLRDVEVRIWNNSGKSVLLDTQYAASTYGWTKERNYNQTGTGYSTTVYVELRSRSWHEAYSAAVVVGTITKARPGNPTLSATPVFNNTSGELAFDWPDIPDADHYEITVNGKVYPSATSKFVYTLAFNMNDNAGTPVATVVYSIKAVDALGQRSTGGSAGTVTKPLPIAPSVSYVWDGATGNLQFTWGTISDAVRYNLDLDVAHYSAPAPSTVFVYDAVRNRADHSGTGDPAITYAIRAQDILQQVSTPASGVATLPRPATPAGLVSSWDSDTGVAGADCVLSWIASTAVASWQLTIDGVSRPVAVNTSTYNRDQNSAEHAHTPDKDLAISLVAVDGLGQTSQTPATRTPKNVAPPAVTVDILGYSTLGINCGSSAAQDFDHYQLRVIKDGVDIATINTSSRNTLANLTAKGTYQVGAAPVDVFGSVGAETLSAAIYLDAISIAELRADALYSDSLSRNEAALAPLHDGGTATWVNYPTGTTWNWTQVERPYLSRQRTSTLAVWHGSAGTVMGYLMVSSDGSTWRYFAGPQTGTVLTEVASEAAAQAAAIAWPAFPTLGRWDLPGFVEARYVRIGHRNTNTTGSYYNLREFYPRRLTQTDDLDVEAVRAVNIGAHEVTADKLLVLVLSALTGDMGSLTAGQIVIGDTNKLWLNDANDGGLALGGSAKASAPFRVTAAGALTATNATITGLVNFNGGVLGGANGLTFNVGTSSGVSTATNFYSGANRLGYIGASYYQPGPTADYHADLFLEAPANASYQSNIYINGNGTGSFYGGVRIGGFYGSNNADTQYGSSSNYSAILHETEIGATYPATVTSRATSGSVTAEFELLADSNAAPATAATLTAAVLTLSNDLEVGYLTSSDYLRFARSTNQTVMRSVHTSSALIDITANANDGTSGAVIRLFRETNTTGVVEFYVLKGDGVNTWQHRLSGHGSDSFLARDNGNIALCGTGSFGGGDGVVAIANRRTAPSSTPSGGGILYVQSGALRYRGSSGNDVQIAGA